MPDKPLCVLCKVEPERLAIRVADVHKVVGGAQLCRLPRLPAAVAGITHHRGRIVTVFDAGVLLFGARVAGSLGSPRWGDPRAALPSGRILVLERAQRHLALAVEGVDEIEPVRLGPDLPQGPCAALRVAQHRGQAVFAVDADRLLEMMLGSGESSGDFLPGASSV